MRNSLVFVVLASLAGCVGTIQATGINHSPVPMTARPAEAVEVFASGPPTRPHADILLLEAKPGLADNDTASEIAMMRREAGAMGCEGLVINSVSAQIVGRNAGERTTVTGTCIVFTDVGQVAAAPARNP